MDIDELSYYYRVLNAYTYIEILKVVPLIRGAGPAVIPRRTFWVVRVNMAKLQGK
jgi:hypothetical protein